MKIQGYRFALSACVAALLLAACGGAQPPIGAPGAIQEAPAVASTRAIVHDVRLASSSYDVFYNFGGYQGDGLHLSAGLLDANGALYGTTSGGGTHAGGTVFSITTSGTEEVLHSFACTRRRCSSSDGRFPNAALIDVNGTLYGTTSSGGSVACQKNGCGTVFSITKTGTEQVLHAFAGAPSDGSNPYASLIDVNGTLYGTTAGGGTNNDGTLFSITTSGTEQVLHSFAGAPSDGSNPYASLVNVNGTLYGTAFGGGTYKDGTVFSITTNGTERVLHSFAGASSDGANPSASLIDVSGELYGTTSAGGARGLGTVFSITKTGKEQLLYSFVGTPDGFYPTASLLYVDGLLYGTTLHGGTNNDGSIFSVTTSGAEQILHSFAGAPSDGANPAGSLIDVNSTLYGATSGGGNNGTRYNSDGTIFVLTPQTSGP
jgi:uncharacterized repeat protein (TIGR03803 family)